MHKSLLLSALCAVIFCFVSTSSYAATISVYWTGHVTSITSFSPGAVPTGVTQNSQISGNLIFESTQYTSRSKILGNFSSGEKYRYTTGLIQTITSEGWEWQISGADVTLQHIFSSDRQSFGTYSTSDNYSYNSFPNFVGRFEYGISLSDGNAPLQLFNSYQINNLALALDEITRASGHLASRHWDQNGDIDDGYYITFGIDVVSLTPVPLPPVLWFFGSGLLVLVGTVRQKKAT
jgi:hypothetical protein